MNDMEKIKPKRVLVAHLQDVLAFPPVINLTEILLAHGHVVYFIGYNVKKMPQEILDNPRFIYSDIPEVTGTGLMNKLKRGTQRKKYGRALVRKYMKKADYLWTTTDLTCRSLGKLQFKYRHIMQLMELDMWYPYIQGVKYFKFPIDEYARKAWKMVEPEVNRAYIQKTIWNLPKTPYVLPNKNYQVDPGEPIDSMKEILEKLRNEKRKIVFYLGIILPERDLEPFMEAIETVKDEYCFYIAGSIPDQYKDRYKETFERYSATEYLGLFPAPKHLHLLENVYIGLLPYRPEKQGKPYISPLNALYCAPNKVFEYSGFGIPMISTDVLALKDPFEKYDIGKCVKDLSVDEIVKAMKEIESKHDEMVDNCKTYYDSIDMDQIVEDILHE